MRLRLFLSIVIAVLVVTSCTSETEQQKNTVNIKRIYVGAETVVDSRTNTDVNTHAVTWAEGDEIAVFNVNGNGRSDYKRFRLTSGAGEQSAYFDAVSESDALNGGETYKLVYPYESVAYDGVDDIFPMAASISGSNNTNHLKDYNWLVSAARTIPTDGTLPRFTLNQSMAIAKIQVNVNNFTVTGLTNRRYLTNVNLTIKDLSQRFSEYVYWNENFDLTTYQYSEVASAGFAGNAVQISNNSHYIYWVPLIQTNDVKELTITVHWAATNVGTSYSAACDYIPKSAFRPGYIYNVHLNLDFTIGSGNSATLTVVE